jgi:glutaredoxin-related protein
MSDNSNCERCGRSIAFNSGLGSWEHHERGITDHEAKLDLTERDNNNEFMPAALSAPVVKASLRCPDCAEPVTKLNTGGYVHDYAAIGEKLAYMKPSVVMANPVLIDDSCAEIMVTAEVGSYDTTELVPMDHRVPVNATIKFAAVNAAMVVYFQEELDRSPDWVERDWATVRWHGERQRCGCPTCRYHFGE